jgi:hypothetical protein
MRKSLVGYYRRLCRSLSQRNDRNFFCKVDKTRLREIIGQNRQALSRIDNWLPTGLVEKSVFHYGVNPEVEPLLNLPLDDECSHSDLLVYLGKTQDEPVKYLELGVSVGKTLWQILNACAPCECWGFDIEEINPVLKQRFTEIRRDEWPSPVSSIKKTPSSISRFAHPPSGSKINYICADIFDESAWSLLAGQRFNLVLSDALHTPEALDFEWQQMSGKDIFHPVHVAIMWDDLDGKMHDWFRAKKTVIAEHLRVCGDNVSTLFLNGWLGKREFPHRLGLAIK